MHYVGRTIAVMYICRLGFSSKNMIYPVYTSDKISVYVHRALQLFGMYKEADELFW